MVANFRLDLGLGVLKHLKDGCERVQIHGDSVVALECVGGEIAFHDLLDAVASIAVGKKFVNAAVLHLRHVGDKPQLAGKWDIVVIEVQGLLWSLENTRVIGVDPRK